MGKKDKYDMGEDNDKLEFMKMSYRLLWSLTASNYLTLINSGNLQKKLVSLVTILNFYLAHESVKMKEGSWMGTDGVVN